MSLFKLLELPLIPLYPRHLANQKEGQFSLSRWRSSIFLVLVYPLSLPPGDVEGGVGGVGGVKWEEHMSLGRLLRPFFLKAVSMHKAPPCD